MADSLYDRSSSGEIRRVYSWRYARLFLRSESPIEAVGPVSVRDFRGKARGWMNGKSQFFCMKTEAKSGVASLRIICDSCLSLSLGESLPKRPQDIMVSPLEYMIMVTIDR